MSKASGSVVADSPVEIHAISERRFNAFIGWTRGPMASVLVAEVEWMELKPGGVLATVFLDRTDKDLWSAILAPDLAGRYRGVMNLGPHANVREAVEATAEGMAAVHNDYEAAREQGDEAPPVDFFANVAPEKLWHRNFRYLREQPAAIGARHLIQLMMRWYENQDGTFVREFQTTAFDARIWELYVWAMLRESGYTVEQPKPAPDFLAHGFDGSFYVEATTANEPPAANVATVPTNEAELLVYVHEYLPTRFSGPLCAKLQKRYWERKGIEDIPFTIAIQDFHGELSMTYSQSALYEYLYGVRIDTVEIEGIVQKVEVPVKSHVWGAKKVPSGFFSLSDSEHISAVMFNAGGTLTKFNRMGIAAGMGDESVTVVHEGTRFALDDSGEQITFSTLVTEGYEEDWVDGLTVFHNPNALRPLAMEAFPGAAHVFENDGLRTQLTPSGHIVSSITRLITRKQSSKTLTTPTGAGG